MQLMRRAALNGVELDSLDDRILIQGIDEAAGRDQVTAVPLGGAPGSRMTGKHRDWLDVTVRFTINEKSYSPGSRDEVMDKVKAWAEEGGVLTVNYKTGKQLRVICFQQPAAGDLATRREYSIVFRAYGVPYWEDVTATTLTMNQDDEGAGTLTLGGSAASVADVTVVNKSGGALQNVTVSVNETEMSFTGLNLANNGSLVVDHAEAGGILYLRAMIGNDSVLGKRSGRDELILKPGNNTIAYEASGDVIVTVSAKGRYS